MTADGQPTTFFPESCYESPITSYEGRSLFGLLCLLILVMTALILALNPDVVEGLRSAIRATARTSFALFLAAFTASAFAVLVPSPFSRTLVRERRFIGLTCKTWKALHVSGMWVLAAVFTYSNFKRIPLSA